MSFLMNENHTMSCLHCGTNVSHNFLRLYDCHFGYQTSCYVAETRKMMCFREKVSSMEGQFTECNHDVHAQAHDSVIHGIMLQPNGFKIQFAHV